MLLGFQKSTSSHHGRVKFTLNVMVCSVAAFEQARIKHAWMPKMITANTGYMDLPARKRIGHLMRQGDTWFTLDNIEDFTDLGEQIVRCISDYAMRYIFATVRGDSDPPAPSQQSDTAILMGPKRSRWWRLVRRRVSDRC